MSQVDFNLNGQELLALKRGIGTVLDTVKIDFGGGCSLEKALVMAGLIRLGQFKNTLDIGVWCGRSFFPQAVAHKLYTGGLVYGVDPYSNEAARQKDSPVNYRQQIDDFIEQFDYDGLYQEVEALRLKQDLQSSCKLVRKRSDEAVEFFKESELSFGLIHVDGNHDTAMVLNDVTLYRPLLITGGFFVLDDISWDSVQPARQHLSQVMPSIYSFQDTFNDFEVYWNGRDEAVLKQHRANIERLMSA